MGQSLRLALIVDNPTAPVFVRYWTKADKAEFWPAAVCPLMTQSGPNVPVGSVRKCRQASGPSIQ